MNVQPLTGPEIQQLSLHGVVLRDGRCWCCGSKRYLKIVDCVGYEYCKISDERVHNYKYKCPYYIVIDRENGDGVCVTPYTDMGNCKGRGESSISITLVSEIVDVIDLIEKYGLEKVEEFIKNDNVVKEIIRIEKEKRWNN